MVYSAVRDSLAFWIWPEGTQHTISGETLTRPIPLKVLVYCPQLFHFFFLSLPLEVQGNSLGYGTIPRPPTGSWLIGRFYHLCWPGSLSGW